MRSPLGKQVRRRFARLMRESLPQFTEIEMDGVPQGCKLYASRTGSDLTFYIQLTINHKYDCFTIEVVWSEKGVYPDVCGVARLGDQPCDGTLAFRIGNFWNPKRDHWWWIGRDFFEDVTQEELLHAFQSGSDWMAPVEEVLPQVDVQVDDAISKILEYAVPYFKRIAAEHGCEWPVNP
jgi:hypothetical protein